jgi:hypothetical protein
MNSMYTLRVKGNTFSNKTVRFIAFFAAFIVNLQESQRFSTILMIVSVYKTVQLVLVSITFLELQTKTRSYFV